jgi:predicted MFS family arabinose efflux permease
MNMVARIRSSPRELLLFAAAALALGMGFSMVDSTFNNFLDFNFHLSGFQRSFLEFPRELPGFLVVFVSAAFSFLCSRRLGALAMIFGAIGTLLLGFASTRYGIMVIWLFILSMGQHLYMPIASTIGMELAQAGKDGRRLGQLNAIRNFAAIIGSFIVFLGFQYLGFTFQHTYALAAILLTVAATLLFSMKPAPITKKRGFLQFHKEYRLYYILNILSGARKQLFITFAPWVLVSVLGQPTQIMATLFTIGGVIGILFQPLLGWTIDKMGERFVLAAEAIILIFVCFGYGFAKFIFSAGTAFYVVCLCFLVDQMVFSVSMARATYLKKISKQPDHIQPALTAAVTIDHVFSISSALAGGVIWNAFGFQYVFLFGASIAVINFFTALQVRLPLKATV